MQRLEDIKFDKSPNYGVRGPNAISLVVIHAAEGTYDGTVATFKNPTSRVSAHFVIGRDGQIVNMVALENAAWHAMHYPNIISIGIEHQDRYLVGGQLTRGCMQDPNWFTLPQLQASANLVAQLMKKFSIPLYKVIGHNDPYLRQFGNNHSCPGPYFPWLKYKQLIQAAMDILNNPLVEVVAEVPKNKGGRPKKNV